VPWNPPRHALFSFKPPSTTIIRVRGVGLIRKAAKTSAGERTHTLPGCWVSSVTFALLTCCWRIVRDFAQPRELRYG